MAVFRPHPGLAWIAALAAVALTAPGCERGTREGRAPPRPNLLVILADDLGVADVGAAPGGVPLTPRIDALARESTSFTRFYAMGDTCLPTRVSLLTGLYPQRLGFRGPSRGLPAETITLPRLLREAGYATHHIGKWQIGHDMAETRPLAQGYDTFFGFHEATLLQPPLPGARVYFDPLLVDGDGEATRHHGHLTDLLTDRAIREIEAADGGRPWFMNLWLLAPHYPLQPPPRHARRFANDREGRYLALVATLDEAVGRVLDALSETGQADDTIVVFLSDNGGVRPESNAPRFGVKSQAFEGALRVPLLVRAPGRTLPGVEIDHPPASTLDLYPTLAALAGVPIAHAVDGRDLGPLLADPGAGREETGSAGPAVPAVLLFWEHAAFEAPWAEGIVPVGGRPAPADLAPGFDLSVLSADGRWRLSKEMGRVALFDLERDPAARVDVSPAHPERMDDLARAYRAWARETRRIPVLRIARGAVRDDGEVAVFDGGSGRLEWRGQNGSRTPGVSPWTLLAGVVAADPAGAAQTLAEQPGVFSLTRESDGRFRLALAGETLEAPGPEPGRCTPVVATATCPSEPCFPEIHLYVEGRHAGAAHAIRRIPDELVTRPTTLGNDASGTRGFRGELRAPQLWSVAPAPSEIEAISAELCDPAAAE